MNQRIKEIALQAGLRVNLDGEIGPAYLGSVDAGYRKFAELIVKEAVAKIEQERFAYPDSNSDTEYDSAQSYYDCGYVDGMYRAETLIRELFGVE